MKSNKALALLLILSFVGIYYFIEKPEVLKRQNENKFLDILQNESQVTKIETQNMQWEKNNELWIDSQSDIPLDLNIVKEFFLKFRKLKLIKEIDQENIENVLTFIPYKAPKIKLTKADGSSIEYVLGNHLGFSEQFYFQEKSSTNDSIYIVEDMASSSAFYRPKDGPAKDYKFRKWQTFLSLKSEIFWNRHLFNDIENLEKTLIKTSAVSKNMEIDFVNQKISVITPKGLSFNKTYLENYKQSFKKVLASKVFKAEEEDLSEIDFQLEIYRSNNEPLVCKVGKKYKNKKGLYLFHPEKKLMYEITNELKSFLFPHPVQFWNLTAIQQVDDFGREAEDIELAFSKNKKLFKIHIPKTKKFTVEVKNAELIPNGILQLKLIIEALIGGGDFGQASHWNSYEKMELFKNWLKVKTKFNEFYLTTDKNKLIIYNTKFNVMLYYKITNKRTLSFYPSDYFKLEGK